MCCPTIWRRDHVLLGVDEFIFGHVRAKNVSGIRIVVRGLFSPTLEIHFVAKLFPQPINCVYCCVCICTLVCIELGGEMGIDQLDKPSV